MIRHPKIKREKGLGLIEVAVAIAVSVVVIAGSLIAFSPAMNQASSKALLKDVATISHNVSFLSSGSSDYANVSVANLIASGSLPGEMISGGNIKDQKGSNILVATSNEGSSCGACRNVYTVTLQDLESNQCTLLASHVFGSHHIRTVIANQGGGVPVTFNRGQPNHVAACSAGGGRKQVSFSFF